MSTKQLTTPDGTEKIKLNEDDSSDIKVVDDWIYYVNSSDYWTIYKMRTDGTERTKLNKDHSFLRNVEGDWIYYINNDDNGKLYKIRTDGSERSKSK